MSVPQSRDLLSLQTFSKYKMALLHPKHRGILPKAEQDGDGCKPVCIWERSWAVSLGPGSLKGPQLTLLKHRLIYSLHGAAILIPLLQKSV